MAEPKTNLTEASVKDFIDSIKDHRVREDCRKVAALMQKATQAKPRMWGAKIVGFGVRSQKYADGSERDWMKIAFSPRKQNLTLYVAPDFKGRAELLAKLGKHTCSKACIHIKRLSDIHLPVLERLIKASVLNVSD